MSGEKEAKETLERGEYLALLGLYTMARSYQKRVVELETEINSRLGKNGHSGSAVSDSIYDPDYRSFDEALVVDGFEVPALTPEKGA